MQRDGDEMYAGADPFGGQCTNEFPSVNIQLTQVEPQDVQVPRVARAGSIRRKLKLRQVAQLPVVNLRIAGSRFDKRIQFTELVNSQSGLNVGQIIFEPGLGDLVIP